MNVLHKAEHHSAFIYCWSASADANVMRLQCYAVCNWPISVIHNRMLCLDGPPIFVIEVGHSHGSCNLAMHIQGGHNLQERRIADIP